MNAIPKKLPRALWKFSLGAEIRGGFWARRGKIGCQATSHNVKLTRGKTLTGKALRDVTCHVLLLFLSDLAQSEHVIPTNNLKTVYSKTSSPLNITSSDGSRSKFFDPDRVRTGQPSMVMVWIWKISPQNVKFFPTDQKKSPRVRSKSTCAKGGSASYLLRVKSMLGLGRVRAHL